MLTYNTALHKPTPICNSSGISTSNHSSSSSSPQPQQPVTAAVAAAARAAAVAAAGAAAITHALLEAPDRVTAVHGFPPMRRRGGNDVAGTRSQRAGGGPGGSE